MPLLPKLHWHGCWRKSHGSFLYPVLQNCIRLTENNGAASIKLTKDELLEIENASVQIEITGTRYTEAMEKSTGL